MSESKAEALTAVLSAMIDPILRRPLGEVGYLRSVRIRRLGTAVVDLMIPVPGAPGHELIEVVTAAAHSVGGVRSVRIEHELMNDDQRTDLMARVRGEKRPVGGPGSSTFVVAVSSGKGGVGKSSVTTNLAVSLAASGHTVGVIDADVWGYSIPRMLGADGAPVVIADSILPLRSHGVSVISIDYFVPDGQAVVWRGPMLHKALEQFLTDVFWDDPSFLLIDMPPGTGDVAISISQFVPRARVLLVTTPQPTARRVASRAARMAERVDQKLIGVVENMSATPSSGKEEGQLWPTRPGWSCSRRSRSHPRCGPGRTAAIRSAYPLRTAKPRRSSIASPCVSSRVARVSGPIPSYGSVERLPDSPVAGPAVQGRSEPDQGE